MLTINSEKRKYEEPIIRIVDTGDVDVITSSDNDWSGEWDYDF